MRKTLAALAVLAALGAAGGALWWLLVGEPQARQRAAAGTADAFLAAWSDRDWPALAARVAPARREEATAAHRGALAGVELDAFAAEPLSVHVDGDLAEATYGARMDVAGVGRYSYEGTLALSWADGAWSIAWSPRVVHPAMVPGGSFATSRTWPQRAAILDRDGVPLAGGAEEAVAVGIEPRRVADQDAVVEALVEHAGASRARAEALLARDDLVDDWFYPVVELPRSAFEAADAGLRPVPGIVFRAGSGERGASSALAVHVVGRVGAATAEEADELGPPYEEGDEIGLYGLEAALEEELAGRPRLELSIVDAAGETVEKLLEVEGNEPQPVRVTLDRAVQAAAEDALAGEGPPAAVVALDVASGDVLAAANRPVAGFNRALEGRYPPGSTFKVVTTAALLEAGLGPDGTLDCPETVTVGGRAFRNAEDLALGEITLREAFTRSCNTAFAGRAPQLGDALGQAALALGFDGRSWLPLPSFGGTYPEPADATELAAAAIGQGRVEASPLHMASVAAAVARGGWVPPRLVLEGDAAAGAGPPEGDAASAELEGDAAAGAGRAGGDAAGAEEGRPLPGDAAVLQALMLEVVASGTGTAAALPGEPVAGKTGSAEFGTASPPETHAWFVGFRGGMAFAVLLEGGGAGGEVAAPLARAFLERLG